MKTCGLVGEFNPFHEGHKRIIEVMKKSCDLTVCVMSGPFVQRGSPALFSKWTRAKIAIQNGIDLVLEIPQAYVLQQASGFALGAIGLLSRVSQMEELFFGVEENFFAKAPKDLLEKLNSPITQNNISSHMENGDSYRRALSASLGLELEANEILALSYLQAMDRLKLSWKIHPVLREGAGHHDLLVDQPCPSASAIRKGLEEGSFPIKNLIGFDQIPQEEKDALGKKRLPAPDPLLSYLKVREILDPLSFNQSPHFEPGMDFRLKKFLKEAKNTDDLASLSSNKRQSISRYRRLILSIALGIEKKAYPLPAYLRPLAFSPKGRILLKASPYPVVQKLADRDLPRDQEELLQIDLKAQALFEELKGFSSGMDYQQNYLF